MLSEAAPTSTSLPEASVKVIIKLFSPFLSSPVALERAMVISPDFVDLMTLSLPDGPALRQAAASETPARKTRATTIFSFIMLHRKSDNRPHAQYRWRERFDSIETVFF